jgi:Phr family secreted Rap phosphatase inhibitor
MKKFSFTLLALALGSTISLGVAASNDDDAAMLTRISNYRQWTRVNSEPVQIQVAVTPTVTGIVVNPDVAV